MNNLGSKKKISMKIPEILQEHMTKSINSIIVLLSYVFDGRFMHAVQEAEIRKWRIQGT